MSHIISYINNHHDIDKVVTTYEMLLEVNSIISSTLEKKEVLKRIIVQTKQLMRCEKCSVLLVDPEDNKLVFDVMTDESDKDMLSSVRLSMGEGIAGYVWKHGQPLMINDVFSDPRFSTKADSKTLCTTKNIVAVPLVVNAKIIGIMEAMNKKSDELFDQFDLHMFQHLCVQAAIAIENAILHEMATTDGLTRLFIKRYFLQRLDEEFKRTKRYKRQAALIMFDIDFFKKVNDTYGHQAGDEALKAVASIIRQNCRDVDIPCRFGGEEMAVLMPETDKEGALFYAHRIKEKIENSTVYYENKEIKLTISGGIAGFPEDAIRNGAEFIKCADLALYSSKDNGRNRITLYEPGMLMG